MNRVVVILRRATGVLGCNMRSKILISRSICLLLIPVFILTAATVSPCCSLFYLSREGVAVFGRNLDWDDPVPGVVVVNKRGAEKTLLPWKGWWPAPRQAEPVSWISLYGSVTFTCYGRDFIEGGMNEAGLTVSEASLASVYPPDDGRPGVSCMQWMQYQLDNFGAVDSVIAHLSDLRPDGEGMHYLVADSGGRCAVIEYLAGEALVYSGSDVEVCAVTNTAYRKALSQMPMDRAFGGDADIASAIDSYGRFVRMAALMRDYDPEHDGDAVDYAFHILSEVGCPDTRRSIVYDIGERCVLWTAGADTTVRRLDLDSLDLSSGTPTLMCGIGKGEPGDVSNLLKTYTLDANREVVKTLLGPVRRNAETIGLLEQRGLTVAEALELIAIHPFQTGQ